MIERVVVRPQSSSGRARRRLARPSLSCAYTLTLCVIRDLCPRRSASRSHDALFGGRVEAGAETRDGSGGAARRRVRGELDRAQTSSRAELGAELHEILRDGASVAEEVRAAVRGASVGHGESVHVPESVSYTHLTLPTICSV